MTWNFFPPMRLFAHGQDGIALLRLAADQFVTFLHRHDPFDLRPGSQRFQGLVGAFVADGADDHALDAAHDMRAVAEIADLLQDGGFVLS